MKDSKEEWEKPADREKVLKGLRMCVIGYHDECPYDDVKGCSTKLMYDAIEIIENQK